MTQIQRKILITLLWGALGAAMGFAYYYFIGCNSGSCSITSNWESSAGIGFLFGAIMGYPTKKAKKNEQDN